MISHYTLDQLAQFRAKAGLGTLSLGVAACTPGELVSSTPIPDSRCGGAGQDTAAYGGYLLGEGMTHAAAIYLANLHNHFPQLLEAARAWERHLAEKENEPAAESAPQPAPGDIFKRQELIERIAQIFADHSHVGVSDWDEEADRPFTNDEIINFLNTELAKEA